MKKTTRAKKTTTAKKRVLTEEQRLKRNAYMREYLKKWNQDPVHKKAKSEYQKARYQRIKAEKARAAKKAARQQMAFRREAAKRLAKPVVKSLRTIAKSAPRKAATKRTVRIGKKHGK